MIKRKSVFGKLQRTPKWKKEEFTEIEYQPTTVKELLTEMKDISELIIDLAYTAILLNSSDIAEEVKYLEVRMDKLNYDIRMISMMAARTKDDAEQLAGILQIAEAAESISNAAGDISNLLILKDNKKPILPKLLSKAEEKIFRMKVIEKSKACNQLIKDLKIESETGIRIIAIRRGDYWIYNPQSDTTIKANDWLIIRGTDVDYVEFEKFLKGEVTMLE
jgi:uncharacterized protein with PhoU and TrkA domain